MSNLTHLENAEWYKKPYRYTEIQVYHNLKQNYEVRYCLFFKSKNFKSAFQKS